MCVFETNDAVLLEKPEKMYNGSVLIMDVYRTPLLKLKLWLGQKDMETDHHIVDSIADIALVVLH